MRPADLLARLHARLRSEWDLLLLWAALALAAPLVPVGSPVARDDLLPWMLLTLCLATLLRARALGDGPHPDLTRRRDAWARLARRAGLALVPAALALVTEAVRALRATGWEMVPRSALLLAGVALLLCLLSAGLIALGRARPDTAWAPPGPALWPQWLGGGVGLVAAAALFGALSPASGALPAVGLGGLLGLSFFAIGLASGDPEHLRQRQATGRRDRRPVRPEPLLFLIAALGPSLSWIGLAWLLGLSATSDFTQAHVIALHVVVWAAALWPREEPTAVACLLHEVIPTGGRDPGPDQAARPFEEHPEGALRVSPLLTQRTRLVHPWVVPVRGPRIARFDDPVRPLWPSPTSPHPFHLLGDARFELDPRTRRAQQDEITVHLGVEGGERGWGSLSEENAQSWRIVVLRPSAPPGLRRSRLPQLYTWDAKIPTEMVQVIDGRTEKISLRDGDLLLVSAEGVAYAYELEIGAPLFGLGLLSSRRVPQLEDYVKVA